MLDDRRQRYRERRGDLAHRHGVPPRQAVEDRSPRRIGERPKGAIECTVPIVNHMVKYPRDARLVKLRTCASHTIEVRVRRNARQSLALLSRTRAAKAALRVLCFLARRGVDRSATSCSARVLLRRSCSEPVLLRASCFAPVLLRVSCSPLAHTYGRRGSSNGPKSAALGKRFTIGTPNPGAGFSGLSGFLGDGCS